MALSDQLSELVVKAKQIEDRLATARQKNKTELEADVKRARESAREQAGALYNKAKAAKGKRSARWDTVVRSWHEHVGAARRSVEERNDADAAQEAAEQADVDASSAIEFALAAMEEAQRAALEADNAHRHADELRSRSRRAQGG